MIYIIIYNNIYNSNKNLFFIFVFYNTLTTRVDGNILAKKILPFFFQSERFVDKTTFNFHSTNKINGFANTQ